MERSGTLGCRVFLMIAARGVGGRLSRTNLCRPFHGLRRFCLIHPGFRCAPPWALCFRLLRRLVEWCKPTPLSCSRRSALQLSVVSDIGTLFTTETTEDAQRK